MANPSIAPGMEAAVPMLAIRGAATAFEFYKKAFGAEEIARLADPAGNIAHGEIRIGRAVVMLAEENPAFNKSPKTLGGSCVILHLYVDDADAVFARAVSLGAKVVFPLSDQFYGDRSGRLEDPFGHLWIISTRKEDVSPEETQRRFEAMMKQGKTP